MSRLLSDLTAAMADAGMEPADSTRIRTDGVLCRFDCTGDRPGKRNGWAVVFADGKRPVVCFGHWARNIKETRVIGDASPMTAIEREQVRMAANAAQRQRAAELERTRARARSYAYREWNNAQPATTAHPYLQAKQVQPHGLRRAGLSLVVPMRDADGGLHSLQYIRPNGKKRFLRGGRIKGCFATVGILDEHILICEGWATGASLLEATGLGVVVAFSAGNLGNVARLMRGKYPDSRITICADNDVKPDGTNPGIEAARQAAGALGVNADLAIPPESGDWNDYINAHRATFTLSEALEHANH